MLLFRWGCALAAIIVSAGLFRVQDHPSSSRNLWRFARSKIEQWPAGQLSAAPPSANSVVATASYESPLSSDGLVTSDIDDPFAGHSELSLTLLVAEVQRRNPSLQAAVAAWASAGRAIPTGRRSRRSDVRVDVRAGGSFPSSSNVQSSYFLGIAQKVPWSGKLALRGQIAQAASNAASFDSQEVQLRLAEATRLAYFDYYLVYRELEINSATTDDFRQFRDTADEKYKSNLVTQQDVLQAEVELAKLESRLIELEQNERVTVARINTLLHRVPNHPLPAPPAAIDVVDSLPNVEFLRQFALEQRPELAAQAARIQAEQASVALACKEFYPDFEFMGRYDQFWTDVVQRPQVGMNVNIPLNQSRRKAAVREAMFRVSKMQAEYAQQVDNIRHDVQTAFARVDASRKTVRLYADKILPAAESNVASANAGYVAGRVDFLRLIEAQRELLELQEKHQEAIAEFHRRQAELERAVGAPIPIEASEGFAGKIDDSLLLPVLTE
jgi:outer membrane protein TolC